MDVRNWPMDRIMQLPDCCFGRRWPVVITTVQSGGGASYGISMQALPEWVVLWELRTWSKPTTAAADANQMHWYLRLGDFLPVNMVQLNAMERVFPSAGYFATDRWRFYGPTHWVRLRMPIHAIGRRFVALLNNDLASNAYLSMELTISSMPTEVPDWMISGGAKDLL